MKVKASVLGFVLIFLGGCSLGPTAKPETNFEETRVYRNFTLDRIWQSSTEAVRQIEFEIKIQQRDSGIIDARKIVTRNDDEIVTLMNVFLMQEAGGVKVKCLIAMPGLLVDIEECRTFARLFFKRLNEILEI